MELRNYQIQGVNTCLTFLQKSHSCYLADEMGLGKTAQSIIAVSAIVGKEDCVLVVCPASLRLNWVREFRRWYPYEEEHLMYCNPIMSGKYQIDLNLTGLHVCIISYDLVSKKLFELTQRKWRVVIFDEAHFLKNRKAKRTSACLNQLIRHCQYKIYLSGTPIPNSVVDAWTVFHAIDNKEFGPFWTFARRYTHVVQNYWGGYECKGVKNMAELRKKVRSTFFIRRLKKDVLTELPDKIYSFIPLKCKMNKEERLLLQDENLGRETVKAIREGRPLPSSEHVATTRRILGEVKVTAAAEYITDLMESERQLVVFAYHKEVIKRLSQRLERKGFRVAVLTGATPAKVRENLVQGFQNQEYDIFLGQQEAAGVGITLTAAKTAVHVETNWRPDSISQANDRLHRIGQKDVVNIQYLVADKSIDHKIIRAVNEKVKIIEGVIG